MKAVEEVKWEAIIEECELHLARIGHALMRLHGLLPLTVESSEGLSDDDIAFLDQLIYRYLKLQDTMGEKLFPLTLSLLGERVDAKPFIDILNRLEKLELIPSRETWMNWRELRNDLTHEYPDDKSERIEAINKLGEAVENMGKIYRMMRKYIEQQAVFPRKPAEQL